MLRGLVLVLGLLAAVPAAAADVFDTLPQLGQAAGIHTLTTAERAVLSSSS